MEPTREKVVIWAVVDAEGEIVDAKTTRMTAFKRVAFLDDWADFNAKSGRGNKASAFGREVLAPFQVVRCVGTFARMAELAAESAQKGEPE